MSERDCKGSANDTDDEAVDPRVQIELERLNTATDDINKLEVDLDEARATFRRLLCESTITIDTMAKKLGSCIEKARPYYVSRFKAKEALREAQKAAVRFERANGQHAAAKEMVYLAEEGLRMEGRSFDHAWQEMLNHATERVNESEHERAISEAEHRHMTALYHNAEHNVQRLQSELKRSVAKSSMDARRSLLLINSIAYRHTLLLLPYYEMKAQFNQMLEKQKTRVGELERSVTEAKMTYAEALRNLEKISDEIHRTRQYDGSNDKPINDQENPTTTSSESSVTGSPDSTDYTSDEYLRLPEKMSPNNTCPLPTKVGREKSSEYFGLSNLNLSSAEPRKYIIRDRPQSISAISPSQPTLNPPSSTSTSCLPEFTTSPTQWSHKPQNNFQKASKTLKKKSPMNHHFEVLKSDSNYQISDGTGVVGNAKTQDGEEWTEISLNNSPDEIYYNNEVYSDEDDQIPYKPLPTELSPDSGNASVVSGTNEPTFERRKLVNQQSLPVMPEAHNWDPEEKKKLEFNRSSSVKNRGKLDTNLSNWISRSSAGNSGEPSGGSSANSSRRQSLDMLWSAGTGERVKELLSHGMMMLNISSLTERRASEPRVVEREEKAQNNDTSEVKRRKVPSPLEKTMTYLNPDEETSDSESLASVEMLSEDQISSLMLEPDMNQVCQEVLGTPLVEVCPLLQELQQQQ